MRWTTNNFPELCRTHTQEEVLEILAEEERTRLALLKRYDGPLSLDEIRDGILLTIENAEALVGDAELLLENARWARAFSLAGVATQLGGVPLA